MTVAHAGKAWAGFGRRPVGGRSPLCPASSRALGARTLSPSELLLGRPCAGGPCWILQSRKKGLSKYSRRAPTQGRQGKLRADAYTRTRGTRVSRTNIAHLFLLTAETSKLMS